MLGQSRIIEIMEVSEFHRLRMKFFADNGPNTIRHRKLVKTNKMSNFHVDTVFQIL